MRFAKMVWNEEQETYEEDEDPAVRGCDWKSHADFILDEIDEQLAPFGLEVVLYETGGDNYVWRIDTRVDC